MAYTGWNCGLDVLVIFSGCGFSSSAVFAPVAFELSYRMRADSNGVLVCPVGGIITPPVHCPLVKPSLAPFR